MKIWLFTNYSIFRHVLNFREQKEHFGRAGGARISRVSWRTRICWVSNHSALLKLLKIFLLIPKLVGWNLVTQSLYGQLASADCWTQNLALCVYKLWKWCHILKHICHDQIMTKLLLKSAYFSFKVLKMQLKSWLSYKFVLTKRWLKCLRM